MATAASAALPPSDSTCRPTTAARGSSATTPPRNPLTWPSCPAGGVDGPSTRSDTLERVPQEAHNKATASGMADRERARIARMPRLVLAPIRAVSLPFVVGSAWPAMAQEKAPERITAIRDAETEALLRKFADPLFRAANLDSRLVRIILVRERAINGFVSSGNRGSRYPPLWDQEKPLPRSGRGRREAAGESIAEAPGKLTVQRTSGRSSVGTAAPSPSALVAPRPLPHGGRGF
jgi:hypothetical protein